MVLGLMDPFWRGVFARVLVASGVVALVARYSLIAGLLAGAVVALVLAAQLRAQISPLRRRVLQLGGEDTDADLDLKTLTRSVAETREQLERTARKAELERDDLRGVLEATSEGILVVGHHLRVELLNDAARRLLDPPVEPLGRSLQEVTRQPEVIAFAEALRRGERPAPVRVEVAHAGGARSVHLSGSLVQGANVRGRAVVVLHDLTDLQHLERVRTDFVANVTHEMRSPLASILGYGETMADDAQALPQDHRDYLERILRNAKRLDDIIRDLIELSRLEHATAPEAQPTDVEGLVAGVVDAIRDRAEEQRIAVEVELTALPPRLMVDSGLVHQALSNLVDNAIKYTPEGGRVRVEGRMASAQGDQAPELVLVVDDTGPGIPSEHLARIFERFYRVDTARSRALGGTGLGLAIVKHAAALHGGRVEVESTPESGSTFTLRLPAAAAG